MVGDLPVDDNFISVTFDQSQVNAIRRGQKHRDQETESDDRILTRIVTRFVSKVLHEGHNPDIDKSWYKIPSKENAARRSIRLSPRLERDMLDCCRRLNLTVACVSLAAVYETASSLTSNRF